MKKSIFIIICSLSGIVAFGAGMAIRHYTELAKVAGVYAVPDANTVESVAANSAVSSSLPSEITFENVFKGNSRYKVNISKTSDRYTVMFFDSNGNVDNMLSVKDLIFDARSSNYTYEGKSRDNSMVMKIRTPRPLDDFIANGVSSQESMNLIEQWDVISVGLFGTNKFTVRQ